MSSDMDDAKARAALNELISATEKEVQEALQRLEEASGLSVVGVTLHAHDVSTVGDVVNRTLRSIRIKVVAPATWSR